MKNAFTLLLVSLSLSVQAQYCMLPGRTSYSMLQPGITNFKLNTINRTSANVEQPLSSPSLTVTTDTTILKRGQSYTVTITHSKDNSSQFFDTSKNNIRVWVDYNNDKDFDDAGETVISADKKYAGVFTASFTVPATAPLGTVRMRVTAKMSQDGGHSIPTPCDMPADPIDYHGEIEDYTLKITAATAISNIYTVPVEVSMFPNPSDGVVTLNLDRIEKLPLRIELYDLTGKLIGTPVNETVQSNNSYKFDVNKYSSNTGVFIVKTTSGENTSYVRLTKTN